jgi:hypothetical protein
MSGLQRLRAFAKSPYHLWSAVLTIGLGLATAHPVGIALGAAAYALAWIYLPDTKAFKRWLAKRGATSPDSREADERAAALRQARQKLFDSLGADRRARYRKLGAVAAAIEAHVRTQPPGNQVLSPDLQMQPVDSLMATFLRLLHTEQVLETFTESEGREDLAGAVESLRAEIGAMQEAAASTIDDPLLESRREKLATLEKRLARSREAAEKLRLTRAEQERVVELVKLARAEVVTSSDPAALRHRIDAGARQMSETSTWTGTWDDSADIDPAFDLAPGSRIGFDLDAPGPPPVPVAE